jgi:formylglycine-generating enzyme
MNTNTNLKSACLLGIINATVAFAVMVNIPSGTFQMGQSAWSGAGNADPSPIHQVIITAPFSMLTTEVTQAMYQEVMGSNPSQFTGDPNRPVDKVTWYDAVLYCNALGKKEGKDTCYTYTAMTMSGIHCLVLNGLACDFARHGYRLPTEAEWEWASRAGAATSYYYGASSNIIALEYMWYAGPNFPTKTNTTTHPVGLLKPNAYGLYDMYGNVQEWCWDWGTKYPSSSQTDPAGPSSGTGKVERGGDWNLWDDHNNSVIRNSDPPASISNENGFRYVMSGGSTLTGASRKIGIGNIAGVQSIVRTYHGSIMISSVLPNGLITVKVFGANGKRQAPSRIIK